jgi:ribosomal protein L33
MLSKKRKKSPCQEFFDNPLVRTGIVFGCAVLLDMFYLKSKNIKSTADRLVQNIFRGLASDKR